jgi:hypothetical protein
MRDPFARRPLVPAAFVFVVLLLAPASDPSAAPADRDICPGAQLYFHADGSWEDGSAWQGQAVAVPDYGSVAEGFPEATGYVCGIRLVLSRWSATMDGTGLIDSYVWEYDPATDNPGAVLSVSMVLVSGVPEFPATMVLDLPMPESYAGPNGFFAGYWPRHALAGQADFGIMVDYDNPGVPRTNWAPGLGYPTGWGGWDIGGYTMYNSLGIGGFVTDSPTPIHASSWGAIKQLYR